MDRINHAKRVIENYGKINKKNNGGSYDSLYGDNKPVLTEVPLFGGSKNIVKISKEPIQISEESNKIDIDNKVIDKVNKLPFNVLYIDAPSTDFPNLFKGTNVFSGGGKVYFQNVKNNRIYAQNTKSETGKKFIKQFLNRYKNKQLGGHVLTPNGVLYLSKDTKLNLATTGGAIQDPNYLATLEKNNLNYIYQTQGGARNQNRKSNKTRKSNRKSNRRQNRK